MPAWRRATATLRELGPFDPAVHLFAEDLELCLRARAAGIPTVLHPAAAAPPRRRARDLALAASRSSCSHAGGARRSSRTLGARALALDDLAQALTFATRTAGHALLGGDAARPRAQLAALRRARRQPVRLTTPAVVRPP